MSTQKSTYIPLTELFKKPNWYELVVYNYSDPRTTKFPLLQSPFPTLAIVLLYLVSVPLLTKFMQSRKPINLQYVILPYNFALVLLSGYMCFEFLYVGMKLGYSFTCQPLDWTYKTDHMNMRMVNVNWLFFFSKIIELADTIFFILRKKNNQVTFLHVYHHATMILNWWLAAKYVPIGQGFFVGIVNSFIHTLMYAYYALSCLGPQMQKYLWWKKYMTTLQLVQFVLVVSHTGYALYFNKSCDFPWLYNFITFYYAWSMMFLFINFYLHTYIWNKVPKKDKKLKVEDMVNGDGPHLNGSVKNGDVVQRKIANGHAH